MATHQTQIKLNLPIELKDFLQSKANKFGLPMASYIKYLIIKNVEEEAYPVFQASERTEQSYKEALEEYKAGKSVPIEEIDDFINYKP